MLDKIPVTHIAGVGAAKQKALADLGIHSISDLLHHFPYRYEDHRILPLSAYGDGDLVTVRAVVQGQATVRWQGRKSSTTVSLWVDQRYKVTGIWFNQHYLKAKLVDGRPLIIRGRYDAERHTIVAARTDFQMSDPVENSQWVPIYSSNRTLSTAQIQKVIEKALDQYGKDLPERIPLYLTDKYRLIRHREAVAFLHAPTSETALHQAHRRLAFEEFFVFQIRLQWSRLQTQQSIRRAGRPISGDAFQVFQQSLPYPLTNAQIRACHAIVADLQKSSPMHRLLQGDVGSGKTWVALFAAYSMWTAGWQSALMAPTEILAEQHYGNAVDRLGRLGMKSALLTGNTSSKERSVILHKLASREIHFVVGTHALLTEDVSFAKLGLVITDEQHRFGVSQRAMLRKKGERPDALFLSATPIPRTLALVIYGDMDVSVLDELPAGRKPIETQWLKMGQEEQAIRFIRRELSGGRQAYVVAPLIDQSEQMSDMVSAMELETRLKEQFAGFKVGLLHGKMSAKDKDSVMRDFIAGRIQVLVSTTVIEVGIDVANATVMLIYHADRFGLAQLHQLRGRVGRGGRRSFCILLSDARSSVAEERLQTLVQTSDGFVIAEKDLSLRGPGEFLGYRQSGLPEFSVGDLSNDLRIMEVARDEAVSLLKQSDFWLLPAYARLREEIIEQTAADKIKE